MSSGSRMLSVAAVAALAMILSGCGSGGGGERAEKSMSTDELDHDALVAAAQEEGELTTYWHSSRIDRAAEAFEQKYGIKVNGQKMSDTEQYQKVSGEVKSGNVQVDVLAYDDGASLITQMLPEEWVVNYVPESVAGDLSEDSKDPVVYLWQPVIWGYNDEVYGNTCPIENIWQLTEPQWQGKVAFYDPDQRTIMYQMFSGFVTNPEPLEEAYEAQYGETLITDEQNAGWEFVKRLAKNKPILASEDTIISEAVGASGQTDPPIGLYYLGRHRDKEELDQHIAACLTMKPYVGVDGPSYLTVLKDAPHPNAARLFAEFVLTDEGVSPWTVDVGGYSSNKTATSSPDNPYATRAEWGGKLLIPDPLAYAETRLELSDFWAANHN